MQIMAIGVGVRNINHSTVFTTLLERGRDFNKRDLYNQPGWMNWIYLAEEEQASRVAADEAVRQPSRNEDKAARRQAEALQNGTS